MNKTSLDLDYSVYIKLFKTSINKKILINTPVKNTSTHTIYNKLNNLFILGQSKKNVMYFFFILKNNHVYGTIFWTKFKLRWSAYFYYNY